MWRGEIEHFADRYDVVAPNLAGFGDSAHLAGPDRIEPHAKKVLDLLDHLGIETFHLVGHSMGGMVVQHMVRLAGDRIARVVLYGTGSCGRMPGRFETADASRQKLAADGVAATSRRIAATWFVKGEDAECYDLCTTIGAAASLQGAIAGTHAFEKWDAQDLLPSFSSPTLIIWGEKDRSVAWHHTETLWRGIPGASLAVCPGCAHNVHMERPQLFQMLLGDFLAGLP